MSEPDLKLRTKVFALRILKLVDALPKSTAARASATQLVRSETSVAANYRAARRAKSTAHFLSKLGDVEEEADETLFWLELVDHAASTSIDSFRCLRVRDAAPVFEDFMSQAAGLNNAGRGGAETN